MKKNRLPALLLALAMVFALAACGGGNEKEPAGEQQGGNTPLTRDDGGSAPLNRDDGAALSGSDQSGLTSFDPGDIHSMMESVNRNNMTPDQIASIEADAKENGYEIDWNADGSLVIIEDGNTLSTSGTWPDNKFTKAVPTPKVGSVTASDLGDDECTVIMNWTAEDAKTYVGELKKAGFDRGAEEQDLAMMGMYTFSASNGELTVSVTFMNGMGGGIEIVPTDLEELEYREQNPDEFEDPISGDELQQALQEAQKQLEGMEIPEGYEDIMGGLDLGNLDLGSLMGSLMGGGS